MKLIDVAVDHDGSQGECKNSRLSISESMGVIAIAKHGFVEFYHCKNDNTKKLSVQFLCSWEDTVVKQRILGLQFLNLGQEDYDQLIILTKAGVCAVQIRFRAWFGLTTTSTNPRHEHEFMNTPLLIKVCWRDAATMKELELMNIVRSAKEGDGHLLFFSSKNDGLFVYKYDCKRKGELMYSSTDQTKDVRCASFCGDYALLVMGDRGEMWSWRPQTNHFVQLANLSHVKDCSWILPNHLFWVTMLDGSSKIYLYQTFNDSCVEQMAYPSMKHSIVPQIIDGGVKFGHQTFAIGAIADHGTTTKVYSFRTVVRNMKYEFSTLLDIARTGFYKFSGSRLLGSHVIILNPKQSEKQVCVPKNVSVPTIALFVLTETGLSMKMMQLPVPMPENSEMDGKYFVERAKVQEFKRNKSHQTTPSIAKENNQQQGNHNSTSTSRIPSLPKGKGFESKLGKQVQALSDRVRATENDLRHLRMDFLQFTNQVNQSMEHLTKLISEKL